MPKFFMTEAASAFWDFSLRFYARPGVAAVCLLLQDGGGADVNVVLYLLFLAAQNRSLDDAAVARLDAATGVWRDEVVRPLRTARRHLKNPAAPYDGQAAAELRSEIKRSELAAERIEQLTIERLFPAATTGVAAATPADAARASLAAYDHLRGGLPAAAVAQLLELFNAQS